MYLVAIAWFYVALLMAAAEAMSSQGSLIGACITFILYGLLPISIVLYVMGAPHRRRALRQREAEERASTQRDGSDHSPAQPLPPVREEP